MRAALEMRAQGMTEDKMLILARITFAEYIAVAA